MPGMNRMWWLPPLISTILVVPALALGPALLYFLLAGGASCRPGFPCETHAAALLLMLILLAVAFVATALLWVTVRKIDSWPLRTAAAFMPPILAGASMLLFVTVL